MVTKSSTIMKLITAAALACGLAIAGSANAAGNISKSKAYTICKAEIKAAYGEDARVKMQKIKIRQNYQVQVFVTHVADERIKATCEIAKNGELLALNPPASDVSIAKSQ